MSHISKGVCSIALRENDLLKRALSRLGKVEINANATIALGGGLYQRSQEQFELVLIDSKKPDFRMGFNQDSSGKYVPYYDDWGALRPWVRQTLSRVTDSYLAEYYKAKLENEGFEVNVFESDGGFQVEFEEAAW